MIQSVRKACILHEGALRLQVSEAVVRFDEITGDPSGGAAFFETTYLTEGLKALLQQATRRLAGASSEASFHLKQAMGGGKTHSITALSYLARHPELRHRILPGVPEARGFKAVRFAAFNGREQPGNFFWGQLIDQLGASDVLSGDVAQAPDEAAWLRVYRKSDDPVLIVLDELPPYFEYLNTVAVGNGTMADRAANAFAGMLSAAHRLKNVCIVVSDLAGSYGTGTSILNRALGNATDELHRQEVIITPVDLDSDEGYAILRKRLIRQMPSDTVMDNVAEAYARALSSAGQAGLVEKNAEQVTREVRATYPFHPETKHLFALFKDNPDYRQTRGLMELGSMLLRSVWEGEKDVYLVGPQHFDMGIREVRERLAEISKLHAAVARDIFDTNGGAVAQIIDADAGNSAASEAAALLLTASLSTTGDANRGLRIRDAMKVLINPLGGEEAYKTAIERLYKNAHHMHRSPEERYYFDRQVNLNVLLSQFAKNAPENRVNQIVSDRLKEIFEPREKTAYVELVDGTEGIDTILERIKGRRVLVAVRPDGKLPPQEVERFFRSVPEKNNVFILTGERSFQSGALEDRARELYATIAAKREILETNPQYQELNERHQAAEHNLTAAITNTYDRLLVPAQRPGVEAFLRDVRIQISSGTGAGSGERIIIEALTKQPRKLFTDITGDDFTAIRAKVEAVAWGSSDEAVYADVERRVRENPAAFWLPPGGMKILKDTAVQREIWEDLGNGRVSRVVKPKTPSVQITPTKTPTPTDHEAVLEIQPVNASASARIYYAENGVASENDQRLTGGKITTTAATIGILIIDPTRPDSDDAPNHSQTRWTTPLKVAHHLRTGAANEPRIVTLHAHPALTLRFTLDGTNPREHGTTYDTPFTVPDTKSHLQVLAQLKIGPLEFEEKSTFDIPARPTGPVVATNPWEAITNGRHTTMARGDGRFIINTRAGAYKALEVIQAGGVALRDADITITNNHSNHDTVVTRFTGRAKMNADTLKVLLEHAHAALGSDDTKVTFRFDRAEAGNHTYLKELDALVTEPAREGEVTQ
jgi:hypothetical protein